MELFNVSYGTEQLWAYGFHEFLRYGDLLFLECENNVISRGVARNLLWRGESRGLRGLVPQRGQWHSPGEVLRQSLQKCGRHNNVLAGGAGT